VGGHKNDRVFRPRGGKVLLKLKTRHSLQENVQDKTAFTPFGGAIDEVFRGLEGDGLLAGGSEQPLQGLANGGVVIDNAHRERFLRHSNSVGPDEIPLSRDSKASPERGTDQEDDLNV
jgi:hypothetical protein